MRYVLAFLMPPAAVLMCGRPRAAMASVPLTLLGWLPGVVHAFGVVRGTADRERAERVAEVILAREEEARRLRLHQRHLGRTIHTAGRLASRS